MLSVGSVHSTVCVASAVLAGASHGGIFPLPAAPEQLALGRKRRDAQTTLPSNPVSLPPLKTRVAQAIAAIDWSKPSIVIWVPGTAEYGNNPLFKRASETVFGGQSPVAVVYSANWRLKESVQDGEETLRAVLDEIRRRKPGMRVLIAGQSQGAWVASNVMQEKKYGDMIERAAFFGHPVTAKNHHHKLNPRVVEINNPGDAVVLHVNGDINRVITAIDQVARGKLLSTIPAWLSIAVRNPAYLGAALLGQIARLPIVKMIAGDPHKYGEDFLAGAVFLATGKHVGRAGATPDKHGITPHSSH